MSKKIDVAVQSNTLIALDRYNWTLQEQKIFLLLVSKIDSIREENFRTIEFTVDEFVKLIGLKEKGSIYTELEKITERMLSRVFCTRDEKEATYFQVLSRAKYKYGEGKVKLTIHEDMKPFLLAINKNFTAIEINQIAKLKSSYSLRIYELLKMFISLGTVTYQLDDLRKKLGISDGILMNFAHFNKRVLNTAKEEINSDKTDLHIEYKPQKTGRKVTSIVFNISYKQSANLVLLPTPPMIGKIEDRNLMQAGDVASNIIDKIELKHAKKQKAQKTNRYSIKDRTTEQKTSKKQTNSIIAFFTKLFRRQ